MAKFVCFAGWFYMGWKLADCVREVWGAEQDDDVSHPLTMGVYWLLALGGTLLLAVTCAP